MSEYGGNRAALRKVIDEYDLDLTTISKNRQKENCQHLKLHRRKNISKPIEEILKKDSQYSSYKLLKRLIDLGYKEKRCEKCGIEQWMDNEITFHLHHIDGDHNNNEIENLQVLCPNCHSQTDNYAGKGNKKMPAIVKEQESKKAQRGVSEDGQRFYDGYGDYKILCPMCKTGFMNKKSSMCVQCYNEQRKIPKISKEELFLIMENNTYYSAAKLLDVKVETVMRWHMYYVKDECKDGNTLIGSDKAPSRDVLKQKIRTLPFLQVAREYGVSDNAIRKWCDTYGLPRHARITKTMTDEEWDAI